MNHRAIAALLFAIEAVSAGGQPVAVSRSVEASRADFKINLRVVDDAGAPVDHANASFSWGRMDGEEPDTGRARAETNHTGIATFTGRTYLPSYAFGVRKEGYYSYEGIHGRFRGAVAGKWQPWNGTEEVLLKPIKNPVPMYRKKIDGVIPAKEHWLGYDLEKGDWVAPHGSGVNSDFEFFVEATVMNARDNYDGTLHIRMPSGGGIYPHAMRGAEAVRLFYTAPGDGYLTGWKWRTACIPSAHPNAASTFIDESAPGRGFVFQVRVSRDQTGKITKALYGRILAGVEFDPRASNGVGYLRLDYHLNPDGTRNLEHDPVRNLFQK